MSGSVISPSVRDRIRARAVPLAVGLGRLGLSPNALTLIGLAIAGVAAAAAALQAWLLAGALVIVGGAFDLFDGALARATGRVSRLGAFLDSTFDRWGEAVVYVGIAWGAVAAGFGAGAVLAAAAMAAAFMVSYARAKAESLGFSPGTGMANVGLAPREVRIAILAVGLIAVGVAGGVVLDDGGQLVLLDGWGAGRWPLGVTLGLIAVLATVTTIQRIIHTIRQATQQEQG